MMHNTFNTNSSYPSSSYPNSSYLNSSYPNNNYTNNSLAMLRYQIREAIKSLEISDNIRFWLQRGCTILQIQQRMQPQWVSNVMNNQQVLQFIQFYGYTWDQVQRWVNLEICQQMLIINQEIINQQMANVTTATIANTNNMLKQQIANINAQIQMNTNATMRQQIATQYKPNNTQIPRNQQSIQMTQNVVNQVSLAQTSNKDINSVPKNPINDAIKRYLEDIKNYVQEEMQSLLNKNDLNDQSWETLVGIQVKLSTVLDSFSKSGKKDSDYLEYSQYIDQFFEYWQEITNDEEVSRSFLDYVKGRFSNIEDHELINLTQTSKNLQAKDLLNTNEDPLNNGEGMERSKLAKRYNAFVAIGNTYKKQDISGLRKYLTQLHSWIQEEYKWIKNKDNKTSAEEMNLFCNVCEYYANVTKCFLNLVERDYGDIFDLNDELFKLYQGEFKEIEKKNNDSPNIEGYVARKLHWLKMNFDQSSPAMLMVSKQFACYKTDSDKHISELQKELQSFKNIKEKNPSRKFEIVTTPDTDSTDNLEVNTQTDSDPYEDILSEVVKSVNTLNADIERISKSNSAQRSTADRARGVAAASLTRARGMLNGKAKENKLTYRRSAPRSVEIRSNFFTWCGWVWYCIRSFFNGKASLDTNLLTHEAEQVIRDQLNNVLSDDNIELLSLGFLSQYKISAVLMQNSKWLAKEVIKPYLAEFINDKDVIEGCRRKVLEAFYNIVPPALIAEDNAESFKGVKYGLLNLVSNVLGVTVNQTIFEFLKVSISKHIKREDRRLDYLSTSEVASSLNDMFSDKVECEKLKSEVRKLVVGKFGTNLKSEFREVCRKIVLKENVAENNMMDYKCNDYTISNQLFELNQEYIKNNIDSVKCSATFSNIFKNDPDFNHRKSFLSKVKLNLQGHRADGQQYLNELQENFLSNLSLKRESQCKEELANIHAKKQAEESVKKKQQNKNDENNIDNNIKDDFLNNIKQEEENKNIIVIPEVTLNEIDTDEFVKGNKSFYCSEPPIFEENGENKGKDEPNNNYPNFNELELSKPVLKPVLKPGLKAGLIDDSDLSDDSNPDFASAPASGSDEMFTNNPNPEEENQNAEMQNIISEDNGNNMLTNNLGPEMGEVDKPNEVLINNQEEENQEENQNAEMQNMISENVKNTINVENAIFTNNQGQEGGELFINNQEEENVKNTILANNLGPEPGSENVPNMDNMLTNDPEEAGPNNSFL